MRRVTWKGFLRSWRIGNENTDIYLNCACFLKRTIDCLLNSSRECKRQQGWREWERRDWEADNWTEMNDLHEMGKDAKWVRGRTRLEITIVSCGMIIDERKRDGFVTQRKTMRRPFETKEDGEECIVCIWSRVLSGLVMRYYSLETPRTLSGMSAFYEQKPRALWSAPASKCTWDCVTVK